MQSKPRHKMPRRGVFRPLLTFLAVIVGLVLVGPISPANADSGECDVSGGYHKLDSSSGSESFVWGTVEWSGTDVDYTVVDGYTIGLCVKAGTAVDSTTVTGPTSGTFQTPPDGPQGQRQNISHIGWKFVETPPPPPQPGDEQRVVPQSEESCELGGVHTWDDVYTTPYVWDEESQDWVLGDETGPVVENDSFTAYTDQEAEDLGCVEVEGEQGHSHHPGTKHDPEVKGEQAVVPTQVEAGLTGAPAGSQGGSSLPLWALSLGAGLFLTGANRLRRASRIPR